MKVSPARKETPFAAHVEVRAITRELDGKPRTLFTSLMDPARYKAEEVFALYHERWEIELAYGEMKTDMLGQAMTLRSQQPDGGQARAVATLLMYNLILLGDHAHRRRGQSAALSHQLHHGAALHRG